MGAPYFLSRAKQWLPKRHAAKTVILMYHRVIELDSDPWSLAVTPEHFAEHLAVLQKHGCCLSLPELVQAHQRGALPERGVVITFDDGYADNLHNAQPLLEAYGLPATIFMVSGQMGSDREFWWDELAGLLLQPGDLPPVLQLSLHNRSHTWHLGAAATLREDQWRQDRHRKAWEGEAGSRLALYYDIWQQLKPLPWATQRVVLDEIAEWAGVETSARPTYRTLTVEELRQLDRASHIEIGAHTLTHPFLAGQSSDMQDQEMQQCKADLEQTLGHSVNSFSYPFGDYTAKTVKLCQAAGFTRACTTQAGHVRPKTHPLLLPRVEVQDWPGPIFERRLAQWFQG